MSIDDLRSEYPRLGFALYALEPGMPVTLEVHTPEGGLYTFTAPSVAAAIDRAFPATQPAVPLPTPPPITGSVFD